MADTTNAVKHGEDITEITEADFSKVAGVGSPANRTPFVLLKARPETGPDSDADDSHAAPEKPFGEPVDDEAAKGGFGNLTPKQQAAFAANAQRMKEGKIGGKKKGKKAKKSDEMGEPHDKDTDSPEADQIEDLVTGSAAKAYCGDPECDACIKAEIIPYIVATASASGVSKATLKTADRKKMPAGQFAYVDPKGDKHLPIHDAAHVQSAMGRFGQQDFSDAPDPDKAKQKAAGKILAAAGKLGMNTDTDSDVAQAAKGAIQDSLGGTRAPEVAGVFAATGVSGVGGPATAGLKTPGTFIPDTQLPTSVSGVIARLRGGESAYKVPAVDQAYTVKNPSPPGSEGVASDIEVVKAAAVTTLMQAMDQIEEQRNAVKDGRYLQIPNASPDPSAAPSSMPWESYDAATLDQVASVLAQCCSAVECIETREQIEALTGDVGDQQDAWDLGSAASCLDQAMSIVARLAYAEGAAAQTAAKSEMPDPAEKDDDPDEDPEEVEKAYRRLRAGDEKALRDAHAALTNVLAEHDQKKAVVEPSSSEPSEGEKIQMELTKEELADQIAASTRKVVKGALKAERKVTKQEAQKAKKQAKKAAQKVALAAALKNANNNGDITPQQMQDGISSEQDADQIASVGGAVQAKYVNKAMKKAVKKAAKAMAKDANTDKLAGRLEALSTELATVGQTVQKFAARPRAGGPILDGIPRGGFLAQEQRVGSGQVAKSGRDADIETLEKQYEGATSPLEKQEIGFKLTRLKLEKSHEQGDAGLPTISLGF